jgi:hypothetical protein
MNTKSVSRVLLKICMQCNCHSVRGTRRQRHYDDKHDEMNLTARSRECGNCDNRRQARLSLPSAKLDIIISVSTKLRLILFLLINIINILKHVNDQN